MDCCQEEKDVEWYQEKNDMECYQKENDTDCFQEEMDTECHQEDMDTECYQEEMETDMCYPEHDQIKAQIKMTKLSFCHRWKTEDNFRRRIQLTCAVCYSYVMLVCNFLPAR